LHILNSITIEYFKTIYKVAPVWLPPQKLTQSTSLYYWLQDIK